MAEQAKTQAKIKAKIKAKRKGPPRRWAGRGKLRFTQREIERARRAAPKEMLRIRLESGCILELVPAGESAGSERQNNDWNEVVKDAPEQKRSS